MKKILFTSVGRRVELLQAFRDAANQRGEQILICGSDIAEDAPALSFCDRNFITSRIRSQSYLPELLEICKTEGIDLLIPTIDTDLLILSKTKKRFEEQGTRVFISEEDKIVLCRDKRLTADFFHSCGVRSPQPVDALDKYLGGFPCFIKPKDGSSSINAYKAKDLEELTMYASEVPDYIIQPFIAGREYTIDAFCDFNGNPIYITPRERLQVRSGEVIKTRICQDPVMIQEAKQIIAGFQPVGPITIQLIREEKTGEDWYIEINPRFGGGSPLSMLAGADSALAALKMLSGEQTCYCELAALDQREYSRFDENVLSAGNAVIPIRDLKELTKNTDKLDVILFDLDDTLYDEKEYVKSGYRAVAKCAYAISPEKSCEEYYAILWDSFCKGGLAIDELAAILGSNYKKELLEVYRKHIPEIELRVGVDALLSALKNSGICLGIITDGRPEGQHSKLDALGLSSDERISEVIITDELAGRSGRPEQFRKPNPIAFEIMQQRFAVPYHRMAYVGDNPKKDFIAPRRLGMSCFWFQNKEGLY